MKNQIKVDLTREEVTAYHKQVMKTSSEDKTWFFKAGFSEIQVEEIGNFCKDKLDTRQFKNLKKAELYIEKEIWDKLKILPNKIVEFDTTSLSMLPAVIEAFREKLIDIIGLKEYKPAQNTLDEIKK